MTDVLLRHEPDGGNIDYVNGQAVMSDGLETAAYLSLFGGNEQDSGDESDNALQWWGNLTESDQAHRLRSRTQYLLRNLPLIPSNLKRLEEAAALDLAWFVDAGPASYVGVTVRQTGVNAVEFAISIIIDDELFSYTFPYQAPQ